MRFKRLKRRTGMTKGSLDATMKVPLIDVMFNLLIFFMLTSNFVVQSGIKVHLPNAISSEVVRSENVVVTQPSGGKYVAFSAVCTHQGCSVATVSDGTINCPCHGSKFKIEDGSVAGGPATSALSTVAITVKGTSISLA